MLIAAALAAAAVGAGYEGGRLLFPRPRSGPHRDAPLRNKGQHRCGRPAFRTAEEPRQWLEPGGSVVLTWDARSAGAVTVSLRDAAAEGGGEVLLQAAPSAAGRAEVVLPARECRHCELVWSLDSADGRWWSCADVELAAIDALSGSALLQLHPRPSISPEGHAGEVADVVRRRVRNPGGGRQLLVSLAPASPSLEPLSLVVSEQPGTATSLPASSLWEGHGDGALSVAVDGSGGGGGWLYLTATRHAGASPIEAVLSAEELPAAAAPAPALWDGWWRSRASGRSMGRARTRSTRAECSGDTCCVHWTDGGDGGKWSVHAADGDGPTVLLGSGPSSPRGSRPTRRRDCGTIPGGPTGTVLLSVLQDREGGGTEQHGAAAAAGGCGGGRCATALQTDGYAFGIPVARGAPPIEFDLVGGERLYHYVVGAGSNSSWFQWLLTSDQEVTIHTSRPKAYGCPTPEQMTNTSSPLYLRRLNGTSLGGGWPTSSETSGRNLDAGWYCLLVQRGAQATAVPRVTLWAEEGNAWDPHVGSHGMYAHPGVEYAGHDSEKAEVRLAFWAATGSHGPFRYSVHIWEGDMQGGATRMRNSQFVAENAELVTEEDGSALPWRKRVLLKLPVSAFPPSVLHATGALSGPLWLAVTATDINGGRRSYAPLHHTMCVGCSSGSQGAPPVAAIAAVAGGLVVVAVAVVALVMRRRPGPPVAPDADAIKAASPLVAADNDSLATGTAAASADPPSPPPSLPTTAARPASRDTRLGSDAGSERWVPVSAAVRLEPDTGSERCLLELPQPPPRQPSPPDDAASRPQGSSPGPAADAPSILRPTELLLKQK